MDNVTWGAVIAYGGMLLVCAVAYIHDVRHPAGGER
jgi:hypothetical protein